MKTTSLDLLSFMICFAAQILFLNEIKILASNAHALHSNSELNSNNQIYLNSKNHKNTKTTEIKSYCTSPIPVLSASPSDTICVGSSVTLIASGCNGAIAWNTGESGSSLIVSPTTATIYAATCTESGCEVSLGDTISIAVNPIPNSPFIAAKECNITPSKVWDKRFGGDDREYLSSILTVNGKEYLLGGSSQSGISGDKTVSPLGFFDYWVVKIDSLGNKVWDKSFGGNGNDQMSKMIATKDKGVLLAGNSNSGISGDRTQDSRGGEDYWIIKIDSLGNKQWDKRFGSNNSDYLTSLIMIENGGFLLGGIGYPGVSGDKTQNGISESDYWVVKIDSIGNKIWDKSFGGAGYDNLSTMAVDYDGGYLIGGSSESPISGQKSETYRGDYDWWILKIDKNGNKIWDKTLGGNRKDGLISINHISNTYPPRYLFMGTSSSGVSGENTSSPGGSSLWVVKDYFWVVKTNSLGGRIWDKSFGGSGGESLRTVTPFEDGAYILGGSSTSGFSGYKTETSRGISDFWVMKMDSAGTFIWDKTFGGNDIESIYSIANSGEGSYILSGWSTSPLSGDKTEDSRGSSDYWIVKMNSCKDIKTLCAGQNYTLTATGCTGRITWSNGLTGNSIVVNLAGTYHATCTINDCTSNMSNSITVFPATVVPPSVNLRGVADNGTIGANTINSSQIIPSGTNTSYHAIGSINLIESFQAQTGSIFKAEIKGCN